MIIIDILYIIGGLLLLVKGGDWLIAGAVGIARRLKLSNMVIGLTIVGFGTSAPEFLVSLQAAMQGSSGIALGNVVGSNIANIALILGMTAAIAIVPAKKITLYVDMPFLLLASLLLLAAAWSGSILQWHGILAMALLIGYVTWQVRNSRKNPNPEEESPEVSSTPMNIWLAIGLVTCACAALTFGADWLVEGASNIARLIGDSLQVAPATMERIIGLTIVAIGTSLPELFASFTAARKGETDMAIGNVIGSNIFNILCVVGASAAIHPIHDAWEGFKTDYLLMIAVTLLLWFMLRTRYRLSHGEGWVLLAIYVSFIASTLLSAI